MVKIAIAQINTTVGDIKGNSEKIIGYIEKARIQKADIVVFPELTITGYPAEDLWLKKDFISENRKALDNIIKKTKEVTAIVGFVDFSGGKRYNSAALIRIPRYSPGREQATRAELRCPDPSCNPYLAFAVMLKAGLDGIRNKMEPPKPVEEDVYEFDEASLKTHNIDTLPGSLGEAMEALKKDKMIQEALGSHTYPIYIAAKKAEFDEFRLQVTKWELDKYFETT